MHVSGRFAHHIKRSTFSFGELLQERNVFFAYHQAHAFLGFVADDFLGGKGRISHGELVNVNGASGAFDQFGKAVEVSSCAVIVYGDDGIVFAFRHGTNHVGHALLHFRIGALDGIQFDGIGELTCIQGRYCRSTHPDAVVVPAHDDDLVTGFGLRFLGVLGVGKSYASSKHDDLVKTVLLLVFLVFKGEYRTCD